MGKDRNVEYMKSSVISRNKIITCVAAHGLCTGCGVCSAICPSGVLTMCLNEDGEFVPVLGDGCKGCNLCISVCPQLLKDNENIDLQSFISNKQGDLLGSSEKLTTWAGYAIDSTRRLRSASGGMLTLVLQYLLDSRQIDAAIVVGSSNSESGLLFEARLVHTVEELDECAGSKYYPVEFSKVLRELKSTKERAAVVGLPCHVSAVRLLMEKSKRFKNQIQFIFGLVCGHGISARLTYLLAVSAKAPLDEIYKVSYRGKEGMQISSDFTFSVFCNGHIVGKPISFQSGLYGAAWVRRLFVPRSCDFCTDCFAEEADATFMDAWLPEYIKDPQGTSLVVSRTSKVAEILNNLSKAGLANLWEVSPYDVIKSQEGVVHYKHELLPDRVYSAISRGKAVPESLVGLAAKGTRAQRKENARYERNRQISSLVWRLHLPVWIRLKMIMLLTGPSIIHRSKLLFKKVLGKRGVLIMKGNLAYIKNFIIKK